MRIIDRRDILRAGGAALASAFMMPWDRTLAAVGMRDPDMVAFNANVLTIDPHMPRAGGFAVRDGRFIAVGDSADMKDMAGPGTKLVDAGGRTITPGFIDCHNHPIGDVLLYEVLVGNPFAVEFFSIEDIVTKMQKRAAETPPGAWVEGYFFDDTKIKDKRLLNVHDLDKVSTDHPVVVYHRGGHTAFYNSKAFAMAGVTKETSNPFGGTFSRFPEGGLDGRVTDLAMAVFDKVGIRRQYSPAEEAERRRKGAAYISQQFARYGLTTVHHQSGDLGALQDIRAAGQLRHRVSYEAREPVLDTLIADSIRSGFGDEWIRFGATFEHMADGSFSERTMAMSRPYPGSNPPYKGNITQSQEDLNAWVEKVHRAGIQLNCHANGDVAIDMVLTAYERALKLIPVADARPKITHCTLVNENLLKRIKALNALPTVFSTYPFYNTDKFPFYGEEIIRNCFALRSMLDIGIVPAAGSDFYPAPFSPFMALQAMVTRTGWDGTTWGANQRISIDEALAVNTINGAYNSHQETVKGSITPGKFADYVMLSADPHMVAPSEIMDIEVLKTVTDGKIVYEA